MKLTKYEHACLDIQEGSDRLIIDPGIFSPSLTNFTNITAVVLTHIHDDHCDTTKIERIIAHNPSVKIFTTQEVAARLNKAQIEAVAPSKQYRVGKLTLEFFGQSHASVDPQTIPAQNIGVLVNDKLYYPGDSLTICPKPFIALAVPSSASWMKIAETEVLIRQSRCSMVFPTHNRLWNEEGHKTANGWQTTFAERSGKQFCYLQPSESFEI